MQKLDFSYFQLCASDGNNLLGRIKMVLKEISTSNEIEEELSQLQKQEAQIEILKAEILRYSFDQRKILIDENEKGTLESFLEGCSESILESCENKLKRLSIIADELISISRSIKSKRPDSKSVIEKWLNIDYLEALANNKYREHVLKLMQDS